MGIFKIVKAWKAYALNENNEIALKRAEICKACEFAEVGTYEVFMKDELKEIEGLKCGNCKCPLSTKLRATNENCPLKKW